MSITASLLAKIFLGFLFYSFLGWAMEVAISLFNEHKFIDRGFLIGPYCPIYGVGMGIVLLVLGDGGDILATFLKGAVFCTILEYVTSYVMEKLFKIRWWDYSEHRFNLNGRVYLGGAVSFGALCCVAIYLVQPEFVHLLDLMDTRWLYGVALTLAVIFLTDVIFSLIIMAEIRKKSIKFAKDGTEQVKEYLFTWLRERSFIHRRYANAAGAFAELRKRARTEEQKLRGRARAEEQKLRKRARVEEQKLRRRKKA